MQVALIAPLCCVGHSWLVMVAVVACSCTDSEPDFAPCILTFALCACSVSILSTGANIPLL